MAEKLAKQPRCGESLGTLINNQNGLTLLGTIVVTTALLLAVMTFRYTEALGSKSVHAIEAREIARLTLNTASSAVATLDEGQLYTMLNESGVDLGNDMTSVEIPWLANMEENSKINSVVVSVQLVDAFGNIITDLPYSFEEMGQYSKLITTKVSFKDMNGNFSVKSDFLVLRQL